MGRQANTSARARAGAPSLTKLGNTCAAYRAQDYALALTSSPSVMTRALIAMDTAACLRVD
ncbi:hypothetical protein [Streptomyces virginiae]|uniref:hypothetical protein n=1 Tax=Streptomyces virginiae TaxID=1961 RepID=UPI0036E6CE0C